jgi:hypothetical protein
MVALGRTLVFAANDKMEEIIMDTKRQRRESRFLDPFARV